MRPSSGVAGLRPIGPQRPRRAETIPHEGAEEAKGPLGRGQGRGESEEVAPRS